MSVSTVLQSSLTVAFQAADARIVAKERAEKRSQEVWEARFANKGLKNGRKR